MDYFTLLYNIIPKPNQEYSDNYFNPTMEMDNEIMDCQLKMYILLFIEDEKEAKRRLKDFSICFDKLSEEKKEYIRRDYYLLIKQREEKEKEKKLIWEKQ